MYCIPRTTGLESIWVEYDHCRRGEESDPALGHQAATDAEQVVVVAITTTYKSYLLILSGGYAAHSIDSGHMFRTSHQTQMRNMHR